VGLPLAMADHYNIIQVYCGKTKYSSLHSYTMAHYGMITAPAFRFRPRPGDRCEKQAVCAFYAVYRYQRIMTLQ